MRISVFVQRGFICQACGVEIDGQMTGEPRRCPHCEELHTNPAEQHAQTPLFRPLAARP
ncbi:MAG: hypothetical protein ACKO3T_04525 [Planctomycetaceae bacterium]